MVLNQTVKLVESEISSTVHASQGSITAVQLSSTFKGSALEGDFQMSRVQIDGTLVSGPQSDTSAELQDGPVYLVLARGDMAAADVTAALNGTMNVDLTPAGGSLNAVKIATEKGIILLIPMNRYSIINDESAAEYTARFGLSYNGPPLGMSLEQGVKRSYVFPKNIGWAWFIFNGGPPLDAEGQTSWYIRMTGRFLDD